MYFKDSNKLEICLSGIFFFLKKILFYSFYKKSKIFVFAFIFVMLLFLNNSPLVLADTSEMTPTTAGYCASDSCGSATDITSLVNTDNDSNVQSLNGKSSDSGRASAWNYSNSVSGTINSATAYCNFSSSNPAFRVSYKWCDNSISSDCSNDASANWSSSICESASGPTDTSCNLYSNGVDTVSEINNLWIKCIGIDTDGKGPDYGNLDYIHVTVGYTPSAGSLTVDIVDSGGSPVGSPSVAMGAKTFSYSYQTATGTFGFASEKIRVSNTTSNPEWNLTMAPSSPTDFWNGTVDYDFNDPTANAGDGGDSDSLGGQMTINASAGTIVPEGGCSSTGLSLQSSASFSEGVQNSITLLTAGATADTSCYWDITGISISQTIPAEQPADSYSIDMTLTVTAV